MNSQKRLEAILQTADTILATFAPFREEGETAAAAAVRMVRTMRAGNKSNAATKAACAEFFRPNCPHFIGLTEAEDQQAAVVRAFKPADRAEAEKLFSYGNAALLYWHHMAAALYIAYQKELINSGSNCVLESVGTEGKHFYIVKFGDIYITHATANNAYFEAYRGEEEEQARRAFKDMLTAEYII